MEEKRRHKNPESITLESGNLTVIQDSPSTPQGRILEEIGRVLAKEHNASQLRSLVEEIIPQHQPDRGMFLDMLETLNRCAYTALNHAQGLLPTDGSR